MNAKTLRKLPKGADLSHIHPDLRDKAVPCSLLTGHPDNPRVHGEANRKAIHGSLKRFQQRNLIVVNRTEAGLRIEAHHEVFRQMLELGSEYVAVAIMEDDPITEMGFLLADNRTGDLSEDDPEKLAPILRQLIDAGEDVDEIGWDDDAVRELLGDEEEDQGGDDSGPDDDAPIDRAAELQKEWGTKLGDVWEIPSRTVPGRCHRVMCGDSTIAENYASVCGSEKPWMMVTDPPYGIEYDPSWRADAGINHNTLKMGKVLNDDIADWAPAWSLFEGNVAYVYHAGAKANIVQTSLENTGFVIRAQIIWAKDRMALSRGDYHWQHEPCWYAVRRGTSAHRTDDRTQTTMWQIPARDDAGTGHGTQKPVECMARPIRNHVFPEGRCVYDPFLGSGTTLIAAEREAVVCIGIELNPNYLAVILERARKEGLEPRLLNV